MTKKHKSDNNNSQPKLGPAEEEAYLQALLLAELVQHRGWSKAETLLASLAQELYPNPKEYDSQEKLILDYTYARGATELAKKFIETLKQQEVIYQNLHTKKEEGRVRDYKIGT